MPKRNREKLMEQSMYDFLFMMNANIRTYPSGLCIMDALGDKERDRRCMTHDACCDKCIADYLNEYPF
jgi:hypothetical protein